MPQATEIDKLDDTSSFIELDMICKDYEEGRIKALADITLSIRRGEFVSIMGPSGCGKSTLLNLLGGLDRASSGKLLFDGKSIAEINDLDAFRAKQIGFVFQSFYLLPNLTAAENVQLPMFEGDLALPERVARAHELLALVGLEDRVQHRPNQLSIGQRQRVAIARALANAPELILADEPTGSLDSQSGKEVMQILTELNHSQSTTLVVVTHDERVAHCGSRLIRILDGRVQSDESITSQSSWESST